MLSEDTNWLVAAGNKLRANRLEQGIALEQVTLATKISKTQLIAIEEGDTSKLPAMVYVRGFVRVYAGFLGISPDSLKAEVLVEADHTQQPSDIDNTLSESIGRRGGKRWFATLAIGACVLLLAYLYQQKDPVTLPAKAPEPVAVSAVRNPQVQAPVSSARQTGSESKQDPASLVVPETVPAPGDGAILKLKVNQDCWLNITIDGAVSQQYDLKVGDLIEWKAKDSIALDLGNAGGVEAEFNGRRLDSFGESGKVVHVVLKPETGSEGAVTNP